MRSINTAKAALVAACLVASGGLLAAAPTLNAEVMVSKLDAPWDMSFLKDGTMFFTEQCKGLSVRLPSGAINKLHALGGVTGYASTSADLFCDGQAGMMGVEVDPDFDKNRFVYVFSSSKLDGKLSNRLLQLKVDATLTNVSDRKDIVADMNYKAVATKHQFGGTGAHNGGRVRFSPTDGFIYVTTGDNHLGIGPMSPTLISGKVLRIDREGKPAAGNNPPPGFDRRVFTYGHRNPQGIAFRPRDGRPFVAEHGPWHSDEVTGLVNGGNGGWDPRPNMAGRANCIDGYCGYSQNPVTNAIPGAKERIEDMPMTDLKTYPNAMKPASNNNGLSQGIFANAFLSGKQWKDWDGQMIVGYSGIGIHGTVIGNRLDVLKISDDGVSSSAVQAVWPVPVGRFRALSQGPDGNLYVVLTDSGIIYRVKPQ
jgi:glucose/arabinose dehydrogenase